MTLVFYYNGIGLTAFCWFLTGIRCKYHIFPISLQTEPVPELQILLKDVSNSSGICDVTLQCQVSGKGEFDISWKRGEPLRDLGDGLVGYQISDNGTSLHLLWWPNASDSTFTCLVRNPIGEKDVSFSLLSICQTDDEGQ